MSDTALSSHATAQEAFWAGAFGDAYVDRSQGASLVAARTALWSKILPACGPIRSAVEFGANVGLNLEALRRLKPDITLNAVEINAKAADQLRARGDVTVQNCGFLDAVFEAPADLAFTSTVLIHLAPDQLPLAYAKLAQSARKTVVICEYYNPAPVEVAYRGHSERLFKRDFAGEFLDAHPEFALADYGFQYHRDPHFPVDDFTWFVLRRQQ